MYAVAPAVLCKNLVATRTQDKRLWIQIISIDIHKKKSVDMDMDIDGK